MLKPFYPLLLRPKQVTYLPLAWVIQLPLQGVETQLMLGSARNPCMGSPAPHQRGYQQPNYGHASLTTIGYTSMA